MNDTTTTEAPPVSGVGLLTALFVGWVAVAAAFAVTVAVVPGISVDWQPLTYLGLALLWGIVNAVLWPLLRLLALPLLIVTLGLFSVVINAALLGIVAWLSPALSIDGFWPAVGAVIVLSIFNTVCSWVLNRLV